MVDLTLGEMLSIAASAFSVFLAVFAIWLAFQQRKESQENYVQTRAVLAEMKNVMGKTEVLVSENFQHLLTSVVDQQHQMLESLKPRPTAEEKYADLLTKLATEDPDKLEQLGDVIIKISAATQQQQKQPDALGQLMLAAIAQQAQQKP